MRKSKKLRNGHVMMMIMNIYRDTKIGDEGGKVAGEGKAKWTGGGGESLSLFSSLSVSFLELMLHFLPCCCEMCKNINHLVRFTRCVVVLESRAVSAAHLLLLFGSLAVVCAALSRLLSDHVPRIVHVLAIGACRAHGKANEVRVVHFARHHEDAAIVRDPLQQLFVLLV